MPQAVTGRRLSYVGQDAYLFHLSVRENLVYGLKHRPLREAPYESTEAAQRVAWIAESERAGNSTLDPKADWVDYAVTGAEDPAELNDKITEVLRLVDLEEDVYLSA